MISEDADGWQIPVGLTPSEAICIDDSDSDCGNESRCNMNQPAAAKSIFKSAVPSNTSGGYDSNHMPISANDNDTANQHSAGETYSDNKRPLAKKENTNPFASFAYQPTIDESAMSCIPKRPKNTLNSSRQSSHVIHPLLKKPKPSFSCGQSKKEAQTKAQSELPEEITDECIKKWHSFANSSDPIELQRFHVLIAARLHARCQEGTVLKAMDRLRTHFENNGLTPSTLSKSNGDEIAPLLSSVLYCLAM